MLFESLHPFNQALVIVCTAGLLALILYGIYHMWQQMDD